MSSEIKVEFGFYTPLLFGPAVAIYAACLAFVIGAVMFIFRFRKALGPVQDVTFGAFFGVVSAIIAAVWSLLILPGLDSRSIETKALCVLLAGLHTVGVWLAIRFLNKRVLAAGEFQ